MINKLKYTAFIVETEEILECSNFKVLYKAARYYASYEGAPCTTVRFYINLPSYQFEGVEPYHTAQW